MIFRAFFRLSKIHQAPPSHSWNFSKTCLESPGGVLIRFWEVEGFFFRVKPPIKKRRQVISSNFRRVSGVLVTWRCFIIFLVIFWLSEIHQVTSTPQTLRKLAWNHLTPCFDWSSRKTEGFSLHSPSPTYQFSRKFSLHDFASKAKFIRKIIIKGRVCCVELLHTSQVHSRSASRRAVSHTTNALWKIWSRQKHSWRCQARVYRTY